MDITSIVLNEDQELGIRAISNWWAHPRRNFFILEGAAGTGKTTMVKYIIKNLLNCKPVVSAPTNEACRQSMYALEGVAVDVMTTYALFGFSFDTGKVEKELVLRKSAEALGKANLIIIDECSMINERLLNEIIRIGKQGKKILFLGHSSQLPPVMETHKAFDPAESPVFCQEWPTFTLGKVERSSGELLEYIQGIEQLIYAKSKLFRKGERARTKDQLREYIISKEGRARFKEDEAKILSYSNREVDFWNTEVRRSLHKGKQLEKYMFKDRILLTNPAETGLFDNISLNKLKEEPSVNLPTNTRFQIKKIDTVKVAGIPCYKLLTFEHVVIYSAIAEQDVIDLKERMVTDIYNLKTTEARVKAFHKLHKVLSCFAKIKHSYAFTTHRSQGMTIPEVWVNWSDMKITNNLGTRHKLLYVACSRAKERLFIVEG